MLNIPGNLYSMIKIDAVVTYPAGQLCDEKVDFEKDKTFENHVREIRKKIKASSLIDKDVGECYRCMGMFIGRPLLRSKLKD